MSDRSEDTPLLRSLRAAVAANPDDVPLRLHLAELLVAAGRAAEAVPHVASALQRVPNSPEARALMTRAMAERDAADKAPSKPSGTGPVDPPTGRNMRPV